MNYTISPTLAKTVIINPESVIDNLFTTLNKINTFLFLPGNYYINDVLLINRSNITLKSTTGKSIDVHIYQNNSEKDSISVADCINIKILNLCLHNTFSGKIALTIANASHTSVIGCNIYGNTDTFTVYYAGPKNITAGAETLNAYNTNNLDGSNIFQKNIVYSMWAGDSVSFSLQKNGIFSSNIIRGGKIAIYMCRDTIINSNSVYDSVSNGIHVSFPSQNIKIYKNIIYESSDSGIKLTNQLEHGLFVPTNYQIEIYGNKIYDSGVFAIEINDGQDIFVYENNMVSTDMFGIYCLNCINVNIVYNIMSYFTVAMWLENSCLINILNNSLNSIYPDEAQNVIKLVNNSSNNNFSNNIITGNIIYDNYSIDSTCLDTILNDNIFNEFLTYEQESKISRLN